MRPLPAATEALLAATAPGKVLSKLRGAVLLITPTTTRTGPGNIFGNVFDLNDNFLYVGEPCGPALAPSEKAERPEPMSPASCGKLIQRLLACAPTHEDVVTMLGATPRPRFPQNSGLGRLISQLLGPLVYGAGDEAPGAPGNTTTDAGVAFAGLCQKKIMVIQERFFGGPVIAAVDEMAEPKVVVPPALLADAALPILLGIRDVREAVPLRMTGQEQAFVCGESMTPRSCAEMIC